MSVLSTYLWKEWRDHRESLLVMAAVLPVIIVLYVCGMPFRLANHASLPSIFEFAAFSIVALALFGELFAGEDRRGTLALLRRVPGGWLPPFLAKVTLLALATVVLVAGAGALTIVAVRLRHGVQLPFEVMKLDAYVLLLLLPLWSIAFSIWMPKSVVALPGGGIVLALFATPIALAVALNPGLEVRADEVSVALRALALAALPIAALSFARGSFVERGRARAALLGLLMTLALFAPGYAWSAWRVERFRAFDPALPTLRFSDGALAPSGRFAYVNAFHAADAGSTHDWQDPSEGDGPFHALRIDLATGEWRELGKVGSRVFAGFGTHSPIPRATAMVLVETKPAFGASSADDWGLGAFSGLLDAETGAPLRVTVDDLIAGRGAAGVRHQRLTNAIALSDGSRAWVEDGVIVKEAADGTRRVLPDSSFPRGLATIGLVHGGGVWLGDGVVYDVARERRVELPRDLLRSLAFRFIRAGAWIVQGSASQSERFDPDENRRTPIPGLEAGESVWDLVSDGRLLVGIGAARDGERAKAALLDPDTGAREPLEVPESAATTAGLSVLTTTPSGDEVVSLRFRSGVDFRFARLHLATRRLDLAAPDAPAGCALVGCSDDDSIVLRAGGRLLRARFGEPGVELLFPKSDR